MNYGLKLQKLVKQRTEHILVPATRQGELEDRLWLEKLYLRLIPFLYDYPDIPLEKLVNYVSPKLTQAESQYLLGRLASVRRKRNVVVVSQGEDDVLLPLTPQFDPRKVPLVVCWCDGGFYTPKERKQGHQNSRKLRGMGLADGVAAYASFRAVIFSPPVGHPAWKEGPLETSNVISSYEAELKAVELGMLGVIERLEKEHNLPPVDQFHLVLYTDCQSLPPALNAPPNPAESQIIHSIRALSSNFAAIHPLWQPRKVIKQQLGH